MVGGTASFSPARSGDSERVPLGTDSHCRDFQPRTGSSFSRGGWEVALRFSPSVLPEEELRF